LEEARRQIGGALDWRHDVILTSGASEAIQIAAHRAKPARRIVGAAEHDAVIAAIGGEAEVVPVDARGLVQMSALERLCSRGPALVAIQLVNNETGVIQPIDDIYRLVTGAGSLLLCDCAQAAGKVSLPDADFIAISGHKFGAPPGAGALLVKDLAALEASGGQERGYRRGTENLPAAAAMAAALAGGAFAKAMPRLSALREQLEREMSASGAVVIAGETPRIATIGAYALPGVASAIQLVQLDLAGISVSAGSACSSGSMKPSRVLSVMDVPSEIASCVIRVSFGASTSRSDIDRFLVEWRKIAAHAKAEAA
jgi:cysteine desulfurase